MSTFEQTPPLVRAPVRSRGRREWGLLVAVVLLLAAAVLPPLVNIGRYQRRIASSISTSLGRPVHMRGVHLRALPSPGIVMTDFEIEEDPAFGAEPSLKAPSVVAQLRLASLWRGRLEVGRIDLDEASINLVRDAAGRWNAGAILTKASTLQNAPTAQTHASAAPRFPYISATNARLNFKQGAEKTPFSLFNADLSMWLSAPDEWQLRLEAQPVRTDLDLDLADTGLLRIEGKVGRAAALGHMPLALRAEWSHAPLGQMSRLVLGRDPGWRGDLHATAELTGDPDDLALSTRFEVANMHRSDYAPAEAFDLDTTCHAAYHHAAELVDHVDCRWPSGDGELAVTGSARLAPTLAPAFEVAAHRLPASFAYQALRLARSGAAPAVAVEGTIDGSLVYGAGVSSPDKLGERASIVLHEFALRPDPGGGSQAVLSAPVLRLSSAPGAFPLLLAPTPISLGAGPGGTPLVISGQLSPDKFELHWSGSTGLAQLAAWSEVAYGRPGLFPVAAGLQGGPGTADLDVSVHGSTLGANSTRTVTEGSIVLHNARYAPDFLPEPVLIPAAVLTLSPSAIHWSAPAVLFHKLPLAIEAWLPLECSTAQDCAARFEATAARLDAAQMEAILLGSGSRGELLDAILARLDLRRTRWPALSGTVHAGIFTVGPLAIRDAVATVAIEGGMLHVQSLAGRALGGALAADGTLDVTSGMPHYSLAARLTGGSATAFGAMFGESWDTGSLDVVSRLEVSGYSAAQLASSATGTLHAVWTHGGLGGNTPLAHFDRWNVDGVLAGEKLTLSHSELVPAAASPELPVSGTVAFDRALALQIASVPVAGTIAHPVLP